HATDRYGVRRIGRIADHAFRPRSPLEQRGARTNPEPARRTHRGRRSLEDEATRMIAAWIIYSLVIGALLYVGVRALELVAHALHISTRFIWVAAISATVALSTRQLVRLNNGLDAASPSLERRIAHRIRSTAPVVLVEHRIAP